jgi:uncharacterized protein YjbI with pentapeptide repeats
MISRGVSGLRLESGETYEDLRITGEALDGDNLRLLELRRVHLVDCDLSNAQWVLPRLTDVTFEGCRTTGFQIHQGRGEGVTVRDCRGRYLQLLNCDWKASRFERCQLTESSIMDCRLGGSLFRECDLSGTVLERCEMRDADLRGCDIGGLRATVDDLAGAILDPDQAAAVLRGQAEIIVVPLGVPVTR